MRPQFTWLEVSGVVRSLGGAGGWSSGGHSSGGQLPDGMGVSVGPEGVGLADAVGQSSRGAASSSGVDGHGVGVGVTLLLGDGFAVDLADSVACPGAVGVGVGSAGRIAGSDLLGLGLS